MKQVLKFIMDNAILVSLMLGCIVGSIMMVYTTDAAEYTTEYKIEQIRQEAELVHHYCHLSEKKYCIANVKRADSLFRVIDRMLSNPKLDNEYQIELIDIRRDLELPRSISDTKLDIYELDSLIKKL